MVAHLNAYVSYHYAKVLSMIFYQFFAKIFQIVLLAIFVVAVVRGGEMAFATIAIANFIDVFRCCKNFY